MIEINKNDWEGSVYYDSTVGDFVTIEFNEGEDEVSLTEAIHAEETVTVSVGEFEDISEQLYQVSQEVVENPEECARELLIMASELVDGYGTKNLGHYSSVDVDFIIEATESHAIDGEYRNIL